MVQERTMRSGRDDERDIVPGPGQAECGAAAFSNTSRRLDARTIPPPGLASVNVSVDNAGRSPAMLPTRDHRSREDCPWKLYVG